MTSLPALKAFIFALLSIFFALFHHMTRAFLLILFMFIPMLSSAETSPYSYPSLNQRPYKKVALGIAGPGLEFNAQMGHAFLLFYDSKEKLSESMAAQFNVSDLEKSSTPELLAFFGVGKRFSLELSGGLSMTSFYQMENRLIFLYHLNLTDEQISTLKTQLQSEYDRRKNNVYTDYNFITRNCLTEALRFLNLNLPSHLQFQFVDNAQLQFKSFFAKFTGAVGLYHENAPFIASPQIAKHPLVVDTQILPPAHIKNAKLFAETLQAGFSFGKACSSDEKWNSLFTKILGQPRLRESESFLKLLKRLFESCQHKERENLYFQVLQNLEFLATSTEARMRVGGYLP